MHSSASADTKEWLGSAPHNSGSNVACCSQQQLELFAEDVRGAHQGGLAKQRHNGVCDAGAQAGADEAARQPKGDGNEPGDLRGRAFMRNVGQEDVTIQRQWQRAAAPEAACCTLQAGHKNSSGSRP